MRRMALLGGLAALACLAVAATAAGGEPKKQLTKADQQRARSILIGQPDLADGFRREPDTPDGEVDCAAADESDLVVTGEADARYTLQRRDFFVQVASAATLYRSVRHAAASWRRSTSRPGFACLRRELAETLAEDGLRIVSMRRVGIAAVGARTFAARIVVAGEGLPERLHLDLVALWRGRAQAVVMLVAAGVPVPDRERVNFSRLVAGRMAKALGLPARTTA